MKRSCDIEFNAPCKFNKMGQIGDWTHTEITAGCYESVPEWIDFEVLPDAQEPHVPAQNLPARSSSSSSSSSNADVNNGINNTPEDETRKDETMVETEAVVAEAPCAWTAPAGKRWAKRWSVTAEGGFACAWRLTNSRTEGN